jgi:hypothetical protein
LDLARNKGGGIKDYFLEGLKGQDEHNIRDEYDISDDHNIPALIWETIPKRHKPAN